MGCGKRGIDERTPYLRRTGWGLERNAVDTPNDQARACVGTAVRGSVGVCKLGFVQRLSDATAVVDEEAAVDLFY